MIERICQHCGKAFLAYACNNRFFCSRACSYAHKSKAGNPDGYRRRPDVSRRNVRQNKTLMTPEVRAKLRVARLGTGEGKTYTKRYGRHEHRIVAEKILGRELLPDEVVHHIDGNPRNNEPENIKVFPNQKAHAAWHQAERRYFMCESKEVSL